MRKIQKRSVVQLLAIAMLVTAVSSRAQDSQKLTLTQVLSLAVENNHDLALARAKYAVAKSQVGVSRANFLPNLDTGIGALYANGFPEAINGQPPSIFALSYSETIFDGPQRGKLLADKELVKNQEVELSRMRDSVLIRAATSYLELAKVRHSLDLLRNERASAQKIIDLTRERSANGMELPIEVTRGELNLARIEQRIVQLTGRNQILTTQLQNWTGLPPERFEDISAGDLPEVEQPAGDIVQIALGNSRILKEAENERAARERILNGARQAYWPSVGLSGQYNILSRAYNYDEFYKTFQRNNLSIGVLIHIPLFSSRTIANVALARNELTEANQNLISLRDKEQVETRQEASDLAEEVAALAVSKLELKLAQENLALLQSRFDQGQGFLKDLEQARLEEGEKWVAFLDADFARQKAQLVLMERTGQLSQVLK